MLGGEPNPAILSLLKAMAKKITWWAEAEIIGVSDRTMRRWRERIEEGDTRDWPTGAQESRACSASRWRR